MNGSDIRKRRLTNILIFLFVFSSVATAFDYYKTGPLSIIYDISKWIPVIMTIVLVWQCRAKISFSKYKAFVYFVFFEMLLITVIVMTLNYSGNASYIFIGIYMLVACLGDDIIDSEFFQRAFEIIAIIGIACFIYFLLFRGFDYSLIIGREWSGYVWSEAYYYCNILWITPYLLILAFIRQKRIVFSIISMFVYLAFNLLFLKRFALVDAFLVVFLILFIRRKQNKMSLNEFIRGILIVAILMAAILFLFNKTSIGSMFDSLIGRFESTSENIFDFDRFVEIREYFKQAGLIKSIFGGGFVNSFIYGTGIERYNLHIGWADYIYHGGILFFVCMFVPLLKIREKSLLFFRMTETNQFYFCAYVLTAFRFLYIGFFVFYPLLLITVLSAISMMKSKVESTYEVDSSSR